MNDIILKLSKESLKRFRRDMRLLTLSPDKKKQVIQRTAWRIKDNAKKAVNQQRSPDGKPWEKRKVGKGKMLKRRAKFLNTKMQGNNTGVLGYKNKKSSELSAEHQYGLEVELAKNQKLTLGDKIQLIKNKNNPCSDSQAKKLKDLGYQIRLKGGRRKNASLREIKARLTMGQAGLIIRLMSKALNQNKQSAVNGKIKLPARPFLDENTQHNAEIMAAELAKVLTLK